MSSCGLCSLRSNMSDCGLCPLRSNMSDYGLCPLSDPLAQSQLLNVINLKFFRLIILLGRDRSFILTLKHNNHISKVKVFN